MSVERMEYYQRKQARIAEIDEKALQKARADVKKLVKLVERALHPIIWNGNLGSGVTTSTVFSEDGRGATVRIENEAGFKASVSVRPRYIYRSFSRRPTGQAEAEAGGDWFSHKGAAVILRKDGTADVERLTEQLVNGWQYWDSRTKAMRQEKVNEAVRDRVQAKFPDRYIRATSYSDKPVRVTLPEFLSEADAVKLLTFLEQEGIFK